jgi:hypothetical protein
MCLELTAGMCGMLGRLRLSELSILVISRSFQRHTKNFIEPSESSLNSTRLDGHQYSSCFKSKSSIFHGNGFGRF